MEIIFTFIKIFTCIEILGNRTFNRGLKMFEFTLKKLLNMSENY